LDAANGAGCRGTARVTKSPSSLRAERFRRRAQELREQAETTVYPEMKRQLLELAAIYEGLAKESGGRS
jgi:hypothetical protein